MANILSIKRRINVANNVSKTTKAMQMIAASKLKRAQDMALSSRPYVEKLTSLSHDMVKKLGEDDINIYMKKSAGNKKTLLLAIAPDKGLCGGLITNLVRELLYFDDQNKDTVYISLGKKIEGTMLKLNRNIIASFIFGTTLPQFDIVYPILKIVDDYFLSEKVTEVKILSTNFVNMFSQVPKMTTLLPIDIENKTKLDNQFSLFEPGPEDLLPLILRHYLEMSLYQEILESYLSEQAARMFAMKNATDNAKSIIEDLTLEYNKERQEKITNEILDIGGAEAALIYE